MSLDGLHLRARPRRVDMRTQEAGVDSTPGARRSDKGVGAALQRKEDKRHLFGRGQFTCDLRFPNLHDVAFLRSPIAHGRIVRIDVPEAVRKQVILAADLKGAQAIRAVTDAPGFKAADYPLLAFAKVLLVGRSEEHTSELQSLMRISYEVFSLKKKTNY